MIPHSRSPLSSRELLGGAPGIGRQHRPAILTRHAARNVRAICRAVVVQRRPPPCRVLPECCTLSTHVAIRQRGRPWVFPPKRGSNREPSPPTNRAGGQSHQAWRCGRVGALKRCGSCSRRPTVHGSASHGRTLPPSRARRRCPCRLALGRRRWRGHPCSAIAACPCRPG